MQVVFFGSPAFAVPCLEALAASGHRLLAVVTQPDRPRGRGLAPAAPAVKTRALELGLPVLQPERLKGDFTASIRALAPDLLVVVAYGRILPGELLAVAPHGAINVHASLLPRHRGASPVQAALLCGDQVTGVTTMRLDAGLDTGPTLLREQTAIGPAEDAEALGQRLAGLGAALLVRTLDRLERGDLAETPQPLEGATYAPKLKAEDAAIDWRLPAEVVERRVRGLKPWPVAETRLPDGRRLKLHDVRAVAGEAGGTPGLVLTAGPQSIEVACGAGRLRILLAQPQDRRPLGPADLVNGRHLRAGDRLGD